MQGAGTLFFVIVMPRTLHFLLPCLELLPSGLDVGLLVNGAAAWEQHVLARRFPSLPQLRLATLPGSSLAHGDVLNLMLENSTRDFGILDHDTYVFDAGLFEQLHFQEDECMLGLFRGTSHRTGLHYPHTYFLYFNTTLLRGLMQRHGVDANLYRRAPTRVRSTLQRFHLSDRSYLKDHHDFFDTLHLMLALAYAEGLEVRMLEPAHAQDTFHVGGTSQGTHHTKDLTELYIQATFLELTHDPEIQRRYAPLIAPFFSSAEIRVQLPPTAEARRIQSAVDGFVQQMLIRRAAHR